MDPARFHREEIRAAEANRRREQDDAAKHAEQRAVEAAERLGPPTAAEVEMSKAYVRSQERIRKYRAAKEGLRVVIEDEPDRRDLGKLREASEKLEEMAASEEGAWN